MLLFCYLCFSLQDNNIEINNDNQNISLECSGPNTFRINDECYCMRGFIGDEPLSPRGCWRCEKCHREAKCAYPGKCICSNGMVGNGKLCEPPIPTINSFSVQGDFVNINYQCTIMFEPYLSYCKFGSSDIINGLSFTNRSISCLIPSNIHGNNIILSLSFDRKNWSNQLEISIPTRSIKKKHDVQHKRYKIEITKERIPFYFSRNTYIVITILISINAAFYFSLQNKKINPDEVPFLQGDMELNSMQKDNTTVSSTKKRKH